MRSSAILLVLALPVAAQVVNPANGHTYLLTSAPMSFAAARAEAAALGGYLVAINDSIENQFVETNLGLVTGACQGSPNTCLWIGLSDESTEGVFLWDSGEPLIFTNWRPGNPNNGGGVEDAVEMELIPPAVGTWNDGEEAALRLGVIEIPTGQIAVQIQEGTATLSQGGFIPDEVYDGIVSQAGNGWAINSTSGVNAQIAVWETTTDLTATTITFRMQHREPNAPWHLIGRFRWSVTADDRNTFADGQDNNGAVVANWTVLDNPIVAVPLGMTFAVLADDSILTGGSIPPVGDYLVTYDAPQLTPGITGIRLEVLQDSSLSGSGPGHASVAPGNFVLTELPVSAEPVPPCPLGACLTANVPVPIGGTFNMLLQSPQSGAPAYIFLGTALKSMPIYGPFGLAGNTQVSLIAPWLAIADPSGLFGGGITPSNVTNANGNWSFSIPIPNDPALLTRTFYSEAYVFDLFAPLPPNLLFWQSNLLTITFQ